MNPILKSYFPIADIIAGTFGKECEVAVHDLEQPDKSVVYVVNGHVTGRKEGQSFDHLIKNVLLNYKFRDDRVINYSFESADGKKIRSSSALIRNGENDVIGMLCINHDVTRYEFMKESLEAFLGASEEDKVVEEPDQNVLEIIDDLILKIIGNAAIKDLPRKRLVELVKFMDDKGIFLVKGAIDKVADLMGVSKVTIYSYLDEAKGKRK